MKILVAAACVAIIAFVGFFFWDRYSEETQTQLSVECTAFRDQNMGRSEPSEMVGDDALYQRCNDYFLENPPADTIVR